MEYRQVPGTQLQLPNMDISLMGTREMSTALSLAGICPISGAHTWFVCWGMSSSSVGVQTVLGTQSLTWQECVGRCSCGDR